MPPHQHVMGEHSTGKVLFQGRHRVPPRAVPAHPLVVERQVIRIDKSGVRHTGAHRRVDRSLVLEGGVVVDDDVRRPVTQLEQSPYGAAVAHEGANVGKQVVLDEHPLELPAPA